MNAYGIRTKDFPTLSLSVMLYAASAVEHPAREYLTG